MICGIVSCPYLVLLNQVRVQFVLWGSLCKVASWIKIFCWKLYNFVWLHPSVIQELKTLQVNDLEKELKRNHCIFRCTSFLLLHGSMDEEVKISKPVSVGKEVSPKLVVISKFPASWLQDDAFCTSNSSKAHLLQVLLHEWRTSSTRQGR